MYIGIKERKKYLDIEWLMPSVDMEDILLRLGIEIQYPIAGDQIHAFCPDHHIFLGREPSHPRWTVNTDTGETFCFTEGRGSNIVWTIYRLLEYDHPRKAVEFMLGTNQISEKALQLARTRKILAKARRKKEIGQDKQVFGLAGIRTDMEKGFRGERLYQFFIKPPEKKRETNISAETVEHYQIFERTHGYYCDRAMIPFEFNGELVGFCAVDLLGERAWKRKHPLQKEEYRKTLYPAGFKSRSYLFGYEDCEQYCEQLIITEGAREVAKLRQEGFTNSVAVLGSTIKSEQILLIAQLCPKEIVLMFDGDEAGRIATESAINVLKRNFNVLRPCYLRHGLDPKNLNHNEIENMIKKSKLIGQR